MSIKVDLDDLPDEIAKRSLAYLLTAGDDGAPHCSQAHLSVDGTQIVTGAGRTTVRHVATRPKVSLLFPPEVPDGHTLIVDGDATIVGADEGAETVIEATWAVLHRN